MTIKFDQTQLKYGDCLLYFRRDLIDWAIALKTWTKVAHIEVYVGLGKSYASRNGIGVGKYDLRSDGLCAVLRPCSQAFYPDRADAWFKKVDGQGYDWKGLLCFTLAVHQGSTDKMYCSEFGTRFYRILGVPIFAADWDADRTPPSFFLVSPAFDMIWSDGDLF